MIQINEKNCTPYIGNAKLKKIVQGSSQIIWEETVVTYKPVYYGIINSNRTNEGASITAEDVKSLSSGSTEFESFPTIVRVPNPYPNGGTDNDTDWNNWIMSEYERVAEEGGDPDEWLGNYEQQQKNIYLFAYPTESPYYPYDEDGDDMTDYLTPTPTVSSNLVIDGNTYKVFSFSNKGGGFDSSQFNLKLDNFVGMKRK